MYEVLVGFVDLQDKEYPYYVGDIFPRKGKRVSKKRIAELASDKNRRGIPLIKEVREDDTN
jgi:hypothetical protein